MLYESRVEKPILLMSFEISFGLHWYEVTLNWDEMV